MDTIQGFILHTPLWVYLLLFYLVARGVIALKTRIVSVNNLYVSPFIIFVISASVLVETYPPFTGLVLFWCAALALGAVIGWFLVAWQSVKADHDRRLIELSGSPFTLVLVIIIFIARYYFGYRLGINSALMHDTSFAVTDMVSSGILTGIFIGRLINFRFRYYKGPPVELERRHKSM